MAEPATAVLLGELYASILLVTFACGIYVVLTGLSLRFLLRRGPDGRAPGQGNRIVLGYVCTMLAVTVTWYGLTARNTARVLVVMSGPGTGGSGGQVFWRPDNIAENVLATVQFLGSDALMLYRAYVIHRRRVLPVLAPLAVFALFAGASVLINLVPLSAEFGGPLALPPVHALASAFYALSATLNVLVTGLIGVRLARRGGSAGAAAVLAESAVLYALCSIVFVVLFQTGSPAQSWFGALMNCSAFLTQAWVIVRVALGVSLGSRATMSSRAAEFTTDIGLPSRIRSQSVPLPAGGLDEAFERDWAEQAKADDARQPWATP